MLRRDFSVGSVMGVFFAILAQRSDAAAPRRPRTSQELYANLKKGGTVGNLTGNAVQLTDYLPLVAEAPLWLLKEFVEAISGAKYGKLKDAADGYVEYRVVQHSSDIKSATKSVYEDINVDGYNAKLLTQTIILDAKSIDLMMADDSISLRQKREIRELIKIFQPIYELEIERCGYTGSIYLISESRFIRTGFSDSARLRNGIDLLQREINREKDAAELIGDIFRKYK